MTSTRPNDGTASIPIDREFVRSGLFARLTNAETAAFLQVVWNGPIAPSRVFGIEQRTTKKCLGRLRRLGLIERTSEGYVSVRDFRDSKDYLWVEPLRYGWISLPARLLLIFLSEWCDGRVHCYHRGMAEAMREILGIKRRRYDELFGELLGNRMVEKPIGKMKTFANAPLEERRALRDHPRYIRGRSSPAKATKSADARGPRSACEGVPEVRMEGPRSAYGGAQKCVQGSASGSSLRDYSWTHSPSEESERGNTEAEQSASTEANSDTQAHTLSKASAAGAGLTCGERNSSEASVPSTAPGERDPSKATPAGMGDASKPLPPSKGSATSREEYFLRIFMETKDIERKYLRGVESSARAHGLKEILDGLTKSQWIWCLDGLRRNTTASFRLFFEGGEHEDLARQAIALTVQRPDRDYIYVREKLVEAIQENADAPGAADAQAVLADFDFEIRRPTAFMVEEYIKGSLLHPRDSVFCYETKMSFSLPVPEWKPRTEQDIRDYGRKYNHTELVERLLAKYGAVVNAPGYEESIRAALAQRAGIEARNDAIWKQKMEEERREIGKWIADPSRPARTFMDHQHRRAAGEASLRAELAKQGSDPRAEGE